MKAKEILEIFEDHFGFEYLNLEKEGVPDFLKELKGVKLGQLEDAIISSQNPKNIYLFAKYIKGANIKKLQDALLNYREDEAIFDLYVSKFAKEIKGANVTEIIESIIKNGFSESIAYKLAKGNKDIDVKRLEDIVISVARAKDEPFRLLDFLDNIKGANKQRLMEVFEEIEMKHCLSSNIN